jgi:hypothetical protein
LSKEEEQRQYDRVKEEKRVASTPGLAFCPTPGCGTVLEVGEEGEEEEGEEGGGREEEEEGRRDVDGEVAEEGGEESGVEGQEGRGRKRKDLGDEGQGGREKGRGERGREGGREGGQGKGIRARIICPSCHRPFLPPSLRPALDSAFQAHASLAGYRGCPRCFTYISSEGGCLKMTCICGCQFCMACGQRRGKAGARAGARAGGREDCGCESRHHVWPDRALTPWKSVSWEWEALERRAREEAKEGGREGGREGRRVRRRG